MAIGTPGARDESGARETGLTRVAPGSIESDWIVAHTNATNAQDAGDFTDLSAIDDEEFSWKAPPLGATRVILRARTTDDATTFTQLPVGELWGIDAKGAPLRLDQDDQSSASRITLNLDSDSVKGLDIDGKGAAAGDDGWIYGDPNGEEGFDIKGCRWIGFPVRTAANITDGASARVVQVLMKFLN